MKLLFLAAVAVTASPSRHPDGSCARVFEQVMAACDEGLTQEVTCDDKGDAFNAKDCSKYILNCVSDGFADFKKCLTEKN